MFSGTTLFKFIIGTLPFAAFVASPSVSSAQWEQISVGSQPWEICDTGSDIWVVVNNAQKVSRISKATGEVTGSFTTTEIFPTHLAFDGSYLWVSCSGLDKFDPQTGTLINHLDIGAFDLAFDGRFIWITEHSGALKKFDPTTESIVQTIGGFSEETNIVKFDGKYLWLPGHLGALYRVDPSDGSLAMVLPSGTLTGRGIVWDGLLLYAGLNGYERDSMTPVSEYGADFYDGRYFWRYDGNPMTEIALEGTFPNSLGARGVLPIPSTFRRDQDSVIYDGESIWVADFSNGVVRRLQYNVQGFTRVNLTLQLTRESQTQYKIAMDYKNVFEPLTNVTALIHADETSGVTVAQGEPQQEGTNSMVGSFDWQLNIPADTEAEQVALRFWSDQFSKDIVVPVDSGAMQTGVSTWLLY